MTSVVKLHPVKCPSLHLAQLLIRVILLGGLPLVPCEARAQANTNLSPATKPLVSPAEITVDPCEPWNNTSVHLEVGMHYRLTTRAVPGPDGRAYADKTMSCTPDGPVGFKGWLFDFFARDAEFPLNPVHWIGPGKIKRLRVLRDRDGRRASFLTVVGCIGRDDSMANTFVMGRECEIVAHASGERVVFSNDWPGGTGNSEHRFDDSESYDNNHGLILHTIERR